MNHPRKRDALKGTGGVVEALSSALCACIISYCVVSFVAGQAGLLAYRDLKITISSMDNRIAELSSRNHTLVELHADLSTNPDRIAREAREIGYVRPGEKIVVLPKELAGVMDQAKLKEMEVIRAGTSTGLPDTLIKLLAVAIGLAVLAASLFTSIFSSTKKRVQA